VRGPRILTFTLGLLIGLGGGLLLAWEVFPPPPGNATPADLAPAYQDLWIVLAAQADLVEGDAAASRRRLEALGLPDLPDRVRALAERGLFENWPLSTVQALARLAQALGARSPALVVILATPVPTRIPPSPTLIPTATPSPTPSPSPSPSPMPSPTTLPTPLPTPTEEATATPPAPNGPTLLESQTRCETPPLLRIYVFDAEGRPRAGVRLWVSGPQGTETLLTGLKPGMAEGYADVQMAPQETYRLGVERPEPTVAELAARPCVDAAGQAGWTGWEVLVRLP